MAGDLRGKRVFITGGAGFIGTVLTRRLTQAGAEVRLFDNLLAQVHGPAPAPEFDTLLVRGDVRDRGALEAAIRDLAPEVVVHLAAETGTGQSADEPSRYAEVNVMGTAHLAEILRDLPRPPEKIVLSATRAVYGEGAYRDARGAIVSPPPRAVEDMAAGRFAPLGPDGAALEPLPTPETLPPAPSSVYGSTKLMQEYLLQQAIMPCRPTILRLQNVYGPGQSLRNPYTGVLSIFCQQASEGKVLDIFEDGEIFRDFVYVDDVAAAFVAACAAAGAAGHVVNIGSGQPASIRTAAALILRELGLPEDRLRISGAYRKGDVRYAVADVARAKTLLGWTAATPLEAGIAALVRWARPR